MLIKNIFIAAVFSLLFTNCEKKQVWSPQITPKKEEITGIEWSTFGGQMGYVEKLIITKDSIHHTYFTAMKDNEMLEHHYKNSTEIWLYLIKSVNLNDFRKIKNGKSNQPVDGTDQQIVIRSKNSQDSIVNGSDDEINYPKIQKFINKLDDIRKTKK